MIEISEVMAGKAAAILVAIGLPAGRFNGKHGACLMCPDEGKNARWIVASERWICSKCGSTGAVDLAMQHLGLSFKETAKYIKNLQGIDKMTAIKTTDDTAKNQARIDGIRAGLKRLTGGDPALKYLASRGIKIPPINDVFYHPSVAYWSDGVQSTHPAMVAFLRDSAGNGVSMHITYLTHDGQKADVAVQKKILPIVAPLPGSAIKLMPIENGCIGVAEGIESALAAAELYGVNTWAAGSDALLAALELPEAVTQLWIFPDQDAVGMAAAFNLAKRYKARDVRVCWESDGNMIEWKPSKRDPLDSLLAKRLSKKEA